MADKEPPISPDNAGYNADFRCNRWPYRRTFRVPPLRRNLNTTPFDRHRGGGHPPTPATPPCVRVRTRRFEKVMNLTPREQRRKAASAKVRIRKRNRQGLRMGQMPGATAAGGSFLRECAAHAQLKQHRPAAALGFPVPPQRSPKSQSNPASQLDQQIGRFAEPKIAAPAPHIGS